MVEGKRKTVSGKTRAEANRKLTRIKADLDRGLPMITGGLTLNAFLDQWLEETVKPSKRPKTYLNYEYLVRVHIKPSLGKHRLEKLTQRHVEQMFTQKRAAGLSEGTIGGIRRVLRAAMNQAMRWDLVPRNVVTLTESVKPNTERGSALTPAQVESIFAAVKGDRLEGLYWVALSLGLRVSELFGLQWADIDFDASVIHVRRQLQYIQRRWVMSSPKTASGVRDLPMRPALAAKLQAHKDAQDLEQLTAGARWRGDEWGLVFCTKTGLPIHERTFREQWAAIRASAGLPEGVRIHDLRHTALSLLADRGAPPATLKAIAGHSHITTTLQLYVHTSTESKEATTALLEDIFPVDFGSVSA
ncbi:MAG TPA: site-specific integrase [Thermomicrobiales bacterium]|nr:site-specific integrase [Thermomicrobiales bacterium]